MDGTRVARRSGKRTEGAVTPLEPMARDRALAWAPARVARWGTWPVSGAYASHLGAFRLCGQGVVCVCRTAPEGDFAFLIGMLDVFRGGIGAAGVVEDYTEEQFKGSFLRELAGEGNFDVRQTEPAIAARLFWGMFGFYVERGWHVEGRELAGLKTFLPPPAGDPGQWLRVLTAGGMVERDLLRIARRHQMDEDFPVDKEPVVLTTARFRTADQEALDRWLRSAEPDLVLVDGTPEGRHYNWTRKYPKRHWSPLARLGGRQSIGDVVVNGNEVRVETKTSSWAGRFAQLLEEKLGPGVEIRGVDYRDVN